MSPRTFDGVLVRLDRWVPTPIERRHLEGVVVTLPFVALVVLLPALVPTEAYQQFLWEVTGTWTYSTPFEQLRALVGVVGGAVAGRRCEDSIAGTATGLQVAVYSVVVLFSLHVAYNLARIAALGGVPGAYLDAVVLPVLFWIVLFPVFLGGGFLGGLLAGWL